MAKKAARKTSPAKKQSGGEAGGAQAHFIEGLLTRGEAVPRTEPKQKLPPGATHWIEGQDETGKPKVKRERFSLQ